MQAEGVNFASAFTVRRRAERFRSARVLQTFTCSAMAIASSTSIQVPDRDFDFPMAQQELHRAKIIVRL